MACFYTEEHVQMSNTKPTKEDVLKVMHKVDAMNLPDGAHWMLIHEKLNLPYGDVFEYFEKDPAFFGVKVS